MNERDKFALDEAVALVKRLAERAERAEAALRKILECHESDDDPMLCSECEKMARDVLRDLVTAKEC